MLPANAKEIIIKGLNASGGTGNVMAYLNLDQTHFDKAFSITNELQNKNLIKLLYSNFNKNMIIVEVTLLGKHYNL
jgi:hypothetical protein